MNVRSCRAALARVTNTPQTHARTAEHAALPLSELQKTLVQQSHFVNQHGLPPDQGSDMTPEQIQTEQQAAQFHQEVASSFLAKAQKAGS